MNALPATYSPAAYSLIDWLSLSGVSYETLPESGAWNSPASSLEVARDAAPVLAENFTEQGAQGEKKQSALPASPAPLAVSFNDLNGLNAAIGEQKDIGLRKTSSNTVFGTGQAALPQLMVITDAPDNHEDISGKGFTGPGNGLIRLALRHAGFADDAVYFTYVSKWRPPGQRALTATELGQLIPWLDEEIRLVRPKAVLTLGESSIRAIMGNPHARPCPFNKKIVIKKEYLSGELSVLPSQKGEFLVKNPTMKKTFWLSLLDFADDLQAVS